MRRALAILAALALGCAAPKPAAAPVADSVCLRRADSLTFVVDSLRSRAQEQRVLVLLAEQQMKRYAKIVGRDPTQARFIVGWTNRAFAGVLLDSAP